LEDSSQVSIAQRARSLDPRNYLGFGHLDLVPTKIVPTSTLMTASDDWFSDFNDSAFDHCHRSPAGG